MGSDKLNRTFAVLMQAMEKVEVLARTEKLPSLRRWLTQLEHALEDYLREAELMPFAPCEATDEVLWMLVLRAKEAVATGAFDRARAAAADLQDAVTSHHRARLAVLPSGAHVEAGPSART